MKFRTSEIVRGTAIGGRLPIRDMIGAEMHGRSEQNVLGEPPRLEDQRIPASLDALLRRICNSSGFRKSKRLQEFVQYICVKWTVGESGQIHERQIAVDVFGRDSLAYDPSSDNTVRVQARILRQKLAEYFAGEGAEEPVILEIPKGGYVPTLVTRESISPLAALPRPDNTELSVIEHRAWNPVFLVVLVLLGVSLCVNGILLLRRFGPVGSGMPDRKESLTSLVIGPGRSTLVVVPDTGYVVTQVLSGRTLSLESYGEAAWRSTLLEDKTSPIGREFWGYMLSRRFTDIFAADFYGQLVRSMPTESSGLELRHPRTLRLQDFEGRNAILLGSPRSNPWAQGFADRLTFRFEAQPGGREFIANGKPRPGEPEVFSAEPLKLGSGVCLAILGVIPNPHPPGRLMFIAGTTASVTDELGKIALTPEALARFRRELRLPALSNIGAIEMVISANVVGEAVTSWKILASRTEELP